MAYSAWCGTKEDYENNKDNETEVVFEACWGIYEADVTKRFIINAYEINLRWMKHVFN